jgi:hypothetical protein
VFYRHSDRECRSPKTDHHLLRDFAKALTTAMMRAGIKRAIIESTAFLFKIPCFPPPIFLDGCFSPVSWPPPSFWIHDFTGGCG